MNANEPPRGRILWIALIVLAGCGGAAFRLPRLALRPMHLDEAVHASMLGAVLERGPGEYVYDPVEYHGPTLVFLTVPVAWLRGQTTYAQLDEVTLRVVPAIFGILTVLLVLGLADGLGWPAAACAAVLTALSTAMVFYSRYYIMEVLLVCFTFAAVVGVWRYARGGRLVWGLIGGASAGLAMATKETWLFQAVAMGLAVLVNWAWGRWVTRDHLAVRRHVVNWRAAAGALAALVVAAVFFSSFFTRARGPLDAILTFGHAVERSLGGGAPEVAGNLHDNPWYFYLERLIYFQEGRPPVRAEAHPPPSSWGPAGPIWTDIQQRLRSISAGGPIWTEGLIVGLAVVGAVAGFIQRGLGRGDAKLIRFLAVYSFVLAGAYSAIPYKTPWIILGPLYGMILLAGVGAAALVRWVRWRPPQVLVVLLLAAGAGQLGWQAWRGSFHWKFYDSQYSPWVYGQTVRDCIRLGGQIEQLAALKGDLTIQIIAPDRHDYWPLPWYLRRLEPRGVRIGYKEELPAAVQADVVIFTPDVYPEIEPRLMRKYEFPWRRGVRPTIVLVVGIQEDLWKQYLRHVQAAASRPRSGR